MNIVRTTAYEVRVESRELNGNEEVFYESIIVDTLMEAKDIADYECDWEGTLGAVVRAVLIGDDRKILKRGAIHSKYEGTFVE